MQREIRFTTDQTGFSFRAVSETVGFQPSRLQVRPESWPMTVLPARVKMRQVSQALAGERWQDLNWHRQRVAGIKMAMADSDVALHAVIFQPRKVSSLANLDLFVSPPDSATILRLGFWPVGSGRERTPLVLLDHNGEPQPVPRFPWQMTPIREGFEILALIPQMLLGISCDTRVFLLEFTAGAAAPDFGYRSASLFGSRKPSENNSHFMKVVPSVSP